jgi:hypothetical protein
LTRRWPLNTLKTLKATDQAGDLILNQLQGKTEFFYDEHTLAGTPSSVPNKGTVTGGRGNLTTIRRYTASQTSVTETLFHDDLGNVIKISDPMTHETQISYADNFSDSINRDSYAFPTQITNPKGHLSRKTYDYNTGLVKTTLDPRNLQTTRTCDLLNRPWTITEPNGRITTYTYTDSTPKVLEEVEVDTGKLRKTEMTFALNMRGEIERERFSCCVGEKREVDMIVTGLWPILLKIGDPDLAVDDCEFLQRKCSA